MQDVALATGVTKMTVSLALRNHPSIPDATRHRILEAAERLGYRPNPLVAALMTELRSRHTGSAAVTIAYITSHASSSDWQKSLTYTKFHRGARDRAQELGYNLEEFILGENGLTGQRLTEILWNRNIRGLILAPAPDVTSAFHINWKHFAVVALGYSITGLNCHRVTSHHKQAVLLALEKLSQRGYRRIGVVLHREDNARVDYNWLAGYDIFLRLHQRQTCAPVLLVEGWSKRQFMRWFNKYRPDAIASLQPRLIDWLREQGCSLPEEVGFAHLGLHPEAHPLSGVVQHCEVIGATAVDLVVEELHHNRLGIPDFPKLVFIPSDWHDGGTTRAVKSGIRGGRDPALGIRVS